MTVDLKLLLHDQPGIDDNKQSWHAEPYTKDGSFRSSSCNRYGNFDNTICSACSKIPNLPSFKKRALRRHNRADTEGNRDTTKIKNSYLTPQEMQKKLELQSKIIAQKDSELFFQKCHQTRTTLRVRNMEENLKEFSRRGSMKAICHKLQLASDQGRLKEKTILMSFFQDDFKKSACKKQRATIPSTIENIL